MVYTNKQLLLLVVFPLICLPPTYFYNNFIISQGGGNVISIGTDGEDFQRCIEVSGLPLENK